MGFKLDRAKFYQMLLVFQVSAHNQHVLKRYERYTNSYNLNRTVHYKHVQELLGGWVTFLFINSWAKAYFEKKLGQNRPTQYQALIWAKKC